MEKNGFLKKFADFYLKSIIYWILIVILFCVTLGSLVAPVIFVVISETEFLKNITPDLYRIITFFLAGMLYVVGCFFLIFCLRAVCRRYKRHQLLKAEKEADALSKLLKSISEDQANNDAVHRVVTKLLAIYFDEDKTE